MKQVEHQEQVALFRWAALQENKHPELKLLFAIPNGGKRDIRIAQKLKAEGVKAGVPDICLPVPRKGFSSLFIELKQPKGTNGSDNQKLWLEMLNQAGAKATLCKGWDNARETILEYLGE